MTDDEILRPVRCTFGAARGFRYGTVPDHVAEALPRWIEESGAHEGEPIKPGRVYRVDDLVVKYFPRAKGLKALWRRPRSFRCARLHEAVKPIRTPRPIVALSLPGDHGLDSLLVYRYVEGSFLLEAWRAETDAVRAFPAFMAALYRHGVLHGDLHPRNLIWDGRDWVLLDLDAIRHPLHRLFARRRIEEKWGRVLFSLDGDSSVRDGFAAFLREAKLPWDPGRAWSRVQAWERRIRIERSPELASSA